MPKHSSWPPTQTRRTPSPARRPDYADDEFDDYVEDDDDDDEFDDDDDDEFDDYLAIGDAI